ncbi:hypothetical protein AWC38_SpisGene4983 [Stylophora pistillata]|uniref:Uncharacterized protein n=1 Tax=Stylophora pistillata TaxID=50429 RepID=A0A2B4SPB2_STYPI|nr:hypothetical protein AWC38_SpisGene4983 [Stylophora pistillata]
MYHSSAPYFNSRAAGYTAGSGRLNEYSAKPASSTSSVYSYKPSSASTQPGSSTIESSTGSRSPSVSYITTGASRLSGELSSVHRDAEPSRGYTGSERSYDNIRAADVSGKPVVFC